MLSAPPQSWVAANSFAFSDNEVTHPVNVLTVNTARRRHAGFKVHLLRTNDSSIVGFGWYNLVSLIMCLCNVCPWDLCPF